MKKIKIAQLGVGHAHANGIFLSIINQSDIFEYVGYCVCPGEEDAFNNYADVIKEEYAKYPRLSLDQLLNYPDLDCVCVEVEEMYLNKYAQMVADKGLHMFIDKPGAVSQDEFEKILKTSKEKGNVVFLAYMYRYNPAISSTIERANQGEFGKIYSIDAQMNGQNTLRDRKWLNNFKGGMMYFLGCHLIDIVLQIKGVPDEIIPYNMATGFKDIQSEDFGAVIFKYKDCLAFIRTCATEPGGLMRRQIVVCGEDATIEIKPTEKFVDNGQMVSTIREVFANDPNGWVADGKTYESEPYDRYDKMLQSFAKAVTGEEKNPYSYEYEALLHKVLLAACGHDIDYKVIPKI